MPVKARQCLPASTSVTATAGTRSWMDARAGQRIFAHLVVRSGERMLDGLVVVLSELRWPQLDGQLVERAGKAERRLVVLVLHAQAGINADIEGLVDRHEGRDGVRDLLAIHFLAVHRQDAGAASTLANWTCPKALPSLAVAASTGSIRLSAPGSGII